MVVNGIENLVAFVNTLAIVPAFAVGIDDTVELGIVNCKSALAPVDAILNVPVKVPALADALNLINTVVVVNVPALVCGSTKLVA